MKNHWKPWAGLAARLVVGGILTATGLQKLSAPLQEFAALLDAYQITPPGVNHWLAGVFAGTELILGLSLLAGYLTPVSAGAALGLLATYITALLSTVLRHLPLTDCGCYGDWIHLTPGQSITVDGILAALAVLAFRQGSRRFSLDNWIKETPR